MFCKFTMTDLNLTIIQANFTVGNIEKNVQKIISTYNQRTQTTNSLSPDLVVFSELAISGYPAEDLYLQPNFQDKVLHGLNQIQKSICSAPILIGSFNRKMNNVAFLVTKNSIKQIAGKTNLPNYGVFDEKRYFKPLSQNDIFVINDYKIGTIICEDVWHSNIAEELSSKGAEIIIALNASPFTINKDVKRKKLIQKTCIKNKVNLIYLNQVGGNDELVFDGGSFACSRSGIINTQLAFFSEEIKNIEFKNKHMITKDALRTTSQNEMIYNALKLALQDYLAKNGFKKVILGLSGGIDSALTAVIAADAIGKENVLAVTLPSKYTSNASMHDAQLLNLDLINLPIEGIAEEIRRTLSKAVELKDGSLTDQNLQARTRGIILMALSNQYGHLLLSTGNKSENAVGYATLYGDMCGGFNLLKDLYKTQIYELAKWRNLPEAIINKMPSAELFYNQTDQDTLPEYELLDKILYCLIEENLSIHETCKKGYSFAIVNEVFNMLKKAEFKRKQSCPGPIISLRSLSKDRRHPITNGFSN